jgi:thiol-disulfide isomerase/thioredoxin
MAGATAGFARNRQRAGAMVACLVIAGLAAGACRGSAPGAGEKAAAGGREGQTLPAFEVTALDGSRYSPASLRGKVVIVDFWDTWCGPCLRALPHLKELSLKHPDEVVVLAIAFGQEGEAKVREVVTRQGLPFPVILLGKQGDLTAAFGNVDQLPTTFLIGPDGVIKRRWIGAQSLTTYENAVKALLPT